jgi:DNA-binding transcriptional MocR family regulator
MSKTSELLQRYKRLQARGLNLDMSRGKPSPKQLDLSADMLDIPSGPLSFYDDPDGSKTDMRNYGGLTGIKPMRGLAADFLEVEPDDIIIGGNASLSMMYDNINFAFLFGVPGGSGPWGKIPGASFLCVVPGYDRHFAICEEFGISMINIGMDENGPLMDEVEKLVADEKVVGMWIVPRYSNPSGQVYSDEVIYRLASMQTGKDFRLFCDDAYRVHHLTENPKQQKNLFEAFKQEGNLDKLLLFSSTSKITHAGAGVGMMATSASNLEWYLKRKGYSSIGPDKVNQLRHYIFLQNRDRIHALMKQHADIMLPKFQAVQTVLDRELGGSDLATWSQPEGGYFISLDTKPHRAGKVVALAAEAGVKLTPAGATFPYGKDPNDSNIRIAPSFPSVEEIEQAMEVLAVCIMLADAEQTE